MNISADTLCLLAVAALFIVFVLPRLMNGMMGYPGGTAPTNYPPNNGPLDGNSHPTYDSPDVESRGSIGRDRGTRGGIFGNVLSRPSNRSGSSGGGIFRSPSSSRGSGSLSSSSTRHDSPDIDSRGGIGRDRD